MEESAEEKFDVLFEHRDDEVHKLNSFKIVSKFLSRLISLKNSIIFFSSRTLNLLDASKQH